MADSPVHGADAALPRTARIEIHQAVNNTQINDARLLMRAFLDWHRRRHVADLPLIEGYFDAHAWERELADLPGHYAPALKGRLLVAYQARQPAGCVALHDLGDGVCEMKRMFVAGDHRGIGIGRALAERVIAEAGWLHYRRMRLDTSRRQTEAMLLYESLGFRRIAPYYPVTAEMQDWLVFYELEL